jgi:hypothetical protein
VKIINIVTSGVLLITLSGQLFATENQNEAKERRFNIGAEISATYDKDNKNQWSDAEVEMTYTFNSKFDALILLKRQGDGGNPNKVITDEAVVNYHFNDDISLSLGKTAIPFGNFDTGMITDPLTKGVNDADKDNERLLILTYNIKDLELIGYTYKAKDKDKDTGLSVNYNNAGFSAGYDYFKDGSSGRGHSQAIQLGFEADNGISGFYETVNTHQLGTNTSAKHIELNYAHTLANLDANLSLAKSIENRVQGNVNQLGVTYGIDVYQGLNIAIERNKVKDISALNSLKITYTF